MDEVTKYERVWAECKRYGKDWMNQGLGRPYKKPLLATLRKGASVIDFGCGTGSSVKWLRSQGFIASGIEIASNAVQVSNIVIGDLREADHVDHLDEADFGVCTDLMEHIPTADVPAVLANIAGKVREAVFFGIARTEDLDGEALGLTLHLTLADQQWWDEQILTYFAKVEMVRYDDGCYLCWAWK